MWREDFNLDGWISESRDILMVVGCSYLGREHNVDFFSASLEKLVHMVSEAL